MKSKVYLIFLLNLVIQSAQGQIQKSIQAGTSMEGTFSLGVCPLCPATYTDITHTLPSEIRFSTTGQSTSTQFGIKYGRLGYRLSVLADATPGVYLDTVWVEGFIGLNTRIFNRQYIFEITVTEPLEPIAEFTVNRFEILEGSKVEFSNLSANAVTDWRWEFGDGFISTAFDTTYTYSQVGTFSVLLIATGPAGVDSISKDIRVYPPGQPGIWNWSYEARNRVSAPISSDQADRIFFTDYDNYVYGLNRFGEEIWKTIIPASKTSSPVIGPRNTVYITAKESNTVSVLYALNSNNGTQKWSFPVLGSALDPVIAADSSLLIATSSNVLYTIRKDGRSSTLTNMNNSITEVPVAHAIGVNGVYFILTSTHLIAYEKTQSGLLELWSWSSTDITPELKYISISIDGTIYLSGNKLYSVNQNGNLNWSFPESNNQSKFSPAILDSTDKIYLTGKISNSNFLFSFDLLSNIRWQILFSEDPQAPSLGLDGNIYLFTEGDTLYCLNALGSTEWKNHLSTNTLTYKNENSPLILSNNRIVVGVNNEELHTFSSSSMGLSKDYWPRNGQNSQNTGRNITYPPILDRHEKSGSSTQDSLFSFYWFPVDLANTYEFEIFDINDLDNPIYSETTLQTRISNLNLGQNLASKCFWRVRAKIGSKFGAWSIFFEINHTTTGIDNFFNEADFKMSVFPNPGIDEINLRLESTVSRIIDLEIIDSFGKKMMTEKISILPGKYYEALSVSGLSRGIYILKLREGKKRKLIKFLIN